MVDPVTLAGDGSNRWLFDSNTSYMQLWTPDPNNNWATAHDITNTDFQVPVGKILYLTNFTVMGANTTESEFNMTVSTSTDDEGTKMLMWGSEGDRGSSHGANVKTWMEIPAGSYLNSRGQNYCVWTGILTTT